MKKNLTICIFLFSAVLCKASEPDSIVYKLATHVPGPNDSVTGKVMIAYNCAGSSPLINVANMPPGSPWDEVVLGAWTFNANSCDSGVLRTFQKFPQLSAIPSNAVIDSARLNLKGKSLPYGSITYGNSYHPGSPYNMYGTNEGLIKRVLQNWSAKTITWNTQPTVSNTNMATIPASTSIDKYDVSVNVTALVQDIVASGVNYGFLLALQYEVFYRNMIFYSSYEADSTKRPELKVYYHYSVPSSVNTMKQTLLDVAEVYPNPTTSDVTLRFTTSSSGNVVYTVCNMQGQVNFSNTVNALRGDNELRLPTGSLPAGVYVIQLTDGENIVRTRLVKQ